MLLVLYVLVSDAFDPSLLALSLPCCLAVEG